MRLRSLNGGGKEMAAVEIIGCAIALFACVIAAADVYIFKFDKKLLEESKDDFGKNNLNY